MIKLKNATVPALWWNWWLCAAIGKDAVFNNMITKFKIVLPNIYKAEFFIKLYRLIANPGIKPKFISMPSYYF